jgi:hypothetical protein
VAASSSAFTFERQRSHTTIWSEDEPTDPTPLVKSASGNPMQPQLPSAVPFVPSPSPVNAMGSIGGGSVGSGSWGAGRSARGNTRIWSEGGDDVSDDTDSLSSLKETLRSQRRADTSKPRASPASAAIGVKKSSADAGGSAKSLLDADMDALRSSVDLSDLHLDDD